MATPLRDYVTTIAGAMESGAVREVSSVYGGYASRANAPGKFPPWQVVERYLRLVYPSLDRRQIRRVRELSQEALAAGRAANRADPTSRVFQGLAPGTAKIVHATAFVPLYRRNPRTGELTEVYRYPASVYVSINATIADVKSKIQGSLPPPDAINPEDTQLSGHGVIANQQWGEPEYGYFQRF